MIIKYCPSCAGRPYTNELYNDNCPKCGSFLETEFVSDQSTLSKRSKLPSVPKGSEASFNKGDNTGMFDDEMYKDEHPTGSFPEIKTASEEDAFLDFGDENDRPISGKKSGKIETPTVRHGRNQVKSSTVSSNRLRNSGTKVIYGRVADYSSSGREDGNYRRLFFQRISDYFLYGQKMEDVLHRFYVKNRDEDAMGYSRSSSELVNVHGTIGGGVSINNNDEVEVHGKYNRDGVFMAREIFVTTDGNHLRVRFQNSPSQMTNSVLVIIALIMVVFTLFHFNGNIFAGFSFFLKSWLAMAVIITVLYFVLFSRLAVARMFFGRKAFPLGSILIISFIATLVYLNWNGIGTSIFSGLWSLLSSVLSTVIVIALIIIAFKNIIKP